MDKDVAPLRGPSTWTHSRVGFFPAILFCKVFTFEHTFYFDEKKLLRARWSVRVRVRMAVEGTILGRASKM
jgi:hypothetical protein